MHLTKKASGVVAVCLSLVCPVVLMNINNFYGDDPAAAKFAKRLVQEGDSISLSAMKAGSESAPVRTLLSNNTVNNSENINSDNKSDMAATVINVDGDMRDDGSALLSNDDTRVHSAPETSYLPIKGQTAPQASILGTKVQDVPQALLQTKVTTRVAGAGGTLPADHILLDIKVRAAGVTLMVNQLQVYHSLNNTVPWGNGDARLHAGLHLITLHQVTGQVMAATSYMTWQTTSDSQFLSALSEIQDGRLLIILGAPDFTTFLEETTITWLMTELGALYIDSLAYKDVWCLVVHKGGRVVLEALTTSLPGRNMTKFDVSPLTLQVAVPPTKERRCGWYGRAGMEERAAFCETYDGYGNFCSCHDPPWSPLPHNILEYQVQEVIPVAIVTARRLPHVLRQVGQLWSSPGGTITPITIFVDGHNPEARALAALLNLPVVEHHNPAPLGSTSRINYHVKFVLQQVFQLYPQADKAIILEDDLDLAPDFIPYFHQTAPLLTSDPMLVCVNAYNYNAFNHTALDPTRLYRVHGVPAYGWMVRRDVAEEMVSKWPLIDQSVDWDWWLRHHMMGERDVLVPEIPRTKHSGGGGIHVTGLEQAYFYNWRPLNTDINVTMDVQGAELQNYYKFHDNAIRTGHVVAFTSHPCKDLSIPRHQVNQSYVVYVNQPDEGRNSSQAYYVAARCLGLDDHTFHENLQMMFTASFYGNQLYIIGCPHSPFCLTNNPADIYSATLEDVQYADGHPFRKMFMAMHVAIRTPPLSLADEINLTNLVHYSIQ